MKKGTRILSGVQVDVSKINQLLTPNPTTSDKDSEDIGVKIRYLIDKLETLLNALASVNTDKLLTTPDNPPNLDTALSAIKTDLDDFRDKSKPIAKGSVFNTSYGTASTNIFASDLTPTNTPSIFRIYIVVTGFTTAPILSVKRSNDGGVTYVTENLNGGNALSNDVAYIFDIIMDSGEQINLQLDQTGTISKLSVAEYYISP